jgi:hypothetical protein
MIIAFACAIFFCFPGCATVMSHGPGNGASADAQGMAAESLERGLGPFGELASGKDVSVKVIRRPGRNVQDPFVLYAGNLLRELVISGGGRYIGEEGGDLRLEIHAAQAGMNATERNLVAPVSQTVRVPLFYSEGFGGISEMIVVARDGRGNPLPRSPAKGEKGETEYYIFRMIGPFRR